MALKARKGRAVLSDMDDGNAFGASIDAETFVASSCKSHGLDRSDRYVWRISV